MHFAVTFFTVLALSGTYGSPLGDTDKCRQNSNCYLPDCLCFNSSSYIGESLPPQFVYLTLDGALQPQWVKPLTTALSRFNNIHGCDNAATFFVSHEYSDYSKVHSLYCKGHEIALRSITSQQSPAFWAQADKDYLAREYSGERQILADYAFVPKSDIKGMRLPFLQLSGDESFSMMSENDILYDATWTSLDNMRTPLWPYTLDYPSKQDCQIDPCPENTHKGRWVVPINDYQDNFGRACNVIEQCSAGIDKDSVLQFLKDNFNRHYKSTKAPFGLTISYAWLAQPYNLEALEDFFDFLNDINTQQGHDEVIVTSIEKILEWIRTPIRSSWTPCVSRTCKNKCFPKVCQLPSPNGQDMRYLTSCIKECPAKYPWI